jgi:hypothetical protein
MTRQERTKMIEPWLQSMVDEFWSAVGEPESFPRHLEQAVLWALPVAVVKLSHLSIRRVNAWLVQRDIEISLDAVERPLHGCSIAYAGTGVMLLDAADPDDERRFTLAHELSHFLVEYFYPRQRAMSRLGPRITEVLDGLRRSTVEERIHAVLQHAPLGVHTHLMARRPDGALGCGRLAEAENRADRLALELLASAAEVQKCLVRPGQPASFQEGVARTRRLLIDDFGLPTSVATAYARALCARWYRGPSVRQWLGL